MIDVNFEPPLRFKIHARLVERGILSA